MCLTVCAFPSGGMQDWNYVNTNCFEVTIELGCYKYPPAAELPKYWEQNRKSLLQFIHQVKQSGCFFLIYIFSPSLFCLIKLFVGCSGPPWDKRNGDRQQRWIWHPQCNHHCGPDQSLHHVQHRRRLLALTRPRKIPSESLCPRVLS